MTQHLYLAGPMRGYPLFNFPAFFEASMKLRKRGWKVTNPAEHDMAAGFNPGLPIEDPAQINFSLALTMESDLRMLMNCDAICLLPGWEESRGAKLERAVAWGTGKAVYFYDESADRMIRPSDPDDAGEPAIIFADRPSRSRGDQ